MLLRAEPRGHPGASSASLIRFVSNSARTRDQSHGRSWWTHTRSSPRHKARGNVMSASQASSTAATAATAARATGPPVVALPRFDQPAAGRMTRDNRAFEEDHRIRGYEVGPDRKTTMITIANLLQEAASNHVVCMWGRSDEGFATDPEMAKENLIFVMTRMQVQMDSYPKWGDLVRFETWFAMSGRMRATREWIITDCESGKQIGRATSTWVTINMKTRRLVKVPDHIQDRLATYQYADEPDARAFDGERMQLKLPDLTSDEEVEVLVPQIARSSDMDMNGHINNVTYINWILETIPEESASPSRQLYQIEIDYKNECTSGDLVHPQAEACEVPGVFVERGCRVDGGGCKAYLHSLSRSDDGTSKELVRARTLWV